MNANHVRVAVAATSVVVFVVARRHLKKMETAAVDAADAQIRDDENRRINEQHGIFIK